MRFFVIDPTQPGAVMEEITAAEILQRAVKWVSRLECLPREVEILQGNIEQARHEGRVPGDPGCDFCGGSGVEHDSDTGPCACVCILPGHLEHQRAQLAEQEAAAAAENKRLNDEAIRREHHHEPDTPCTKTCPIWF